VIGLEIALKAAQRYARAGPVSTASTFLAMYRAARHVDRCNLAHLMISGDLGFLEVCTLTRKFVEPASRRCQSPWGPGDIASSRPNDCQGSFYWSKRRLLKIAVSRITPI
jgi:hypothetical protein